jgi:hypothetical protein
MRAGYQRGELSSTGTPAQMKALAAAALPGEIGISVNGRGERDSASATRQIRGCHVTVRGHLRTIGFILTARTPTA